MPTCAATSPATRSADRNDASQTTNTPSGKRADEVGGDSERQRGLPHSARAGHRRQRDGRDALGDLGDLAVPPHQPTRANGGAVSAHQRTFRRCASPPDAISEVSQAPPASATAATAATLRGERSRRETRPLGSHRSARASTRTTSAAVTEHWARDARHRDVTRLLIVYPIQRQNGTRVRTKRDPVAAVSWRCPI